MRLSAILIKRVRIEGRKTLRTEPWAAITSEAGEEEKSHQRRLGSKTGATKRVWVQKPGEKGMITWVGCS